MKLSGKDYGCAYAPALLAGLYADPCGSVMDGDFGNDFVTITDEDGNEFELEHLGSAELDGSTYMAFLPADMDEEDDDFGMIILKAISEGDEELFVSIDDDRELEKAYQYFVDSLYEEE